MLVLGRIRRWMLGNVCRKSITSAGGICFGLGCFFFNKRLEISLDVMMMMMYL